MLYRIAIYYIILYLYVTTLGVPGHRHLLRRPSTTPPTTAPSPTPPQHQLIPINPSISIYQSDSVAVCVGITNLNVILEVSSDVQGELRHGKDQPHHILLKRTKN